MTRLPLWARPWTWPREMRRMRHRVYMAERARFRVELVRPSGGRVFILDMALIDAGHVIHHVGRSGPIDLVTLEPTGVEYVISLGAAHDEPTGAP